MSVIELTRGDRRFGDLVRRLRLEAGLSLNDIAARCHVSRKAAWHREQRTQAMSAHALFDVLEALGYDLIAVPKRPETEAAA